MITPNPRCFGVWGVIGKRVEVENPNGVSAKCAIGRIWWPEATRLEDPLVISNGMWALKSSGERDGILSLV